MAITIAIGANGDRHWRPLAPFKWRHLIHSMAILRSQSPFRVSGSFGDPLAPIDPLAPLTTMVTAWRFICDNGTNCANGDNGANGDDGANGDYGDPLAIMAPIAPITPMAPMATMAVPLALMAIR